MLSVHCAQRVVFSLISLVVVESVKIQNLGGVWELQDGTNKFSGLNATVPGGIYSDLMSNSIIGNVFYGFNDTATRWVAKSNWTYSRDFQVKTRNLQFDNIKVIFEGLDTFSTIFINDVEIGKSDNMFVQYIFEVKSHLKIGTNSIKVEFKSPISWAQNLAQNSTYTIPPECPPGIYNGECHVNQIRKMQSSFSWDWGPAFPSVGIWKNVFLEYSNSSVIRYVLTDLEELENNWIIHITTYLDSGISKTISGSMIYTLPVDNSIILEIQNVNKVRDGSDNEFKIDYPFTISKLVVKNWWPNGYGEQKLYNLSVTFRNSINKRSRKSLRIGFRKIELMQEPLGSAGLSFYFKVNNVPIFAKGSNEIPLNILPELGTSRKTISNILKSAKDVNMNMIRVWGGGVYESDYFYDLADEFGILIWQDFMFACAMYPANPTYLNNVIDEIRHQVKRLNHHACIALWAGNNENEVALVTNWYGTKNNLTLYKNDYIKLYVETVRTELRNISNRTIYLTSSPTNGKESETEGFLATNPQDSKYGDVHYYNYVFNSLKANTYPIPRFASEFGYQSLPDIDAWLTVTDNEKDLDPASKLMNHRQHSPGGLLKMDLLTSFQLQLPSRTSPNYYKAYIFYSQILQAISIKFEVEYYRSFMGRLTTDGRGNTMGALFWQLNDVWVAPTWSGIDFTGKWKMLHYFAKNFFWNVIITGYLNTERLLEIYAIADSYHNADQTVVEATATVEVFNWTCFTPVNTESYNISFEFGKSVQITTLSTDDYLRDLGCGSLSSSRNSCFFRLTLKLGSILVAPENFVIPNDIKNAVLNTSKVEIRDLKMVDNSGNHFQITIWAEKISLFVWLDSHEIRGKFSENGFHLVSDMKIIDFFPDQAVSDSNLLKQKLTVTHLKDPEYFS